MIRAFLVDDEQPSRDRLKQMLASVPDVSIVGEADNGEEALNVISRVRPDLVFLDIQMPGLTGMEVAAALPAPAPQVIFCTAFDQYALDAFEHHAVDYLLKPVNRQRLERALKRVRTSIDEEQERRSELERAVETQTRLFPQVLPLMKNLDYYAAYLPARGVGGDYYDFLKLDASRLGIALGDISGKGLSAALLMASLQAHLRSRADENDGDLSSLMLELNRSLCDSTESGRYATFFYAVFDDASRQLTYVNAGHNPPLLFRRSREDGGYQIRRLDTGGLAIGLFPTAAYEQEQVVLEPGDMVVLFTDGASEAFNPQEEEFGVVRLISAAEGEAGRPARQVCDQLLAAIQRFTRGAPLQDDLTLVVCRVKGAGE